MNTTQLLKLKDLTPQDKIVLLVINENTLWGQCIMTSAELATAAGLTRKKVLDILIKLEELDFIQCKVEGNFRSRSTKLTQRLINITK
jgi:transcription initiation factor IIE alpha subunit